MDVLEADWFILQDPAVAGEHIVMESVGVKLSPLWLSQLEAQLFANASPAARGMLVQKLDSPVVKEAYLLALQMLEVGRVLVGYQTGMPNAQSMEIAVALRQIRQLMKPTLKPN